MEVCLSQKREHWLDVAKLLGILAVFVGHFDELAGASGPFVSLYQNALFFFCAGYCHSGKKDSRFVDFFSRKCRHLLLPGLLFSLMVLVVSILFQIITGTVNVELMQENIKRILLLRGLGLGNWFFTGLLSVSVIFEAMRRCFAGFCKNTKNRGIVLLVVFLFMWCIPASFIDKLQFCNIGSAFSYGIYYAMGNWIKASAHSKFQHGAGMHVLGMLALILSIYIYFLCWKETEILPLVSTVTIIAATLYIAKLLEKYSLLGKWGGYTLYCCGNEYLIRHAFDKVLSLDDLISNKIILEIACWLVAICFVVIVVYLIYPLENYWVVLFKERIR